MCQVAVGLARFLFLKDKGNKCDALTSYCQCYENGFYSSQDLLLICNSKLLFLNQISLNTVYSATGVMQKSNVQILHILTFLIMLLPFILGIFKTSTTQ